MIDGAIKLCTTPRPAIMGAVIIAGGCATLPFSATAGTAVVLAGLVITTLALAIFEIIRNMDREIKAAFERSKIQQRQFEQNNLEETAKIRSLIVEFLKLKPQIGICAEKLYNEDYWQNYPLQAFKQFESNLILLINNSIWDELKNNYAPFMSHSLKNMKTLSGNSFEKFHNTCKELNQLLNNDPSHKDIDAQKEFIEDCLQLIGELETFLESVKEKYPNLLPIEEDCKRFKEIIGRCAERLRLAGEIEQAYKAYQDKKAAES